MISGVRIYFEGSDRLKPGFSTFFHGLLDKCRSRKLGWTLVSGDTPTEACKDFHRALADHPSALNILLVDAEAPVSTTHPWEHLASRPDNRLPKPKGAAEAQAHLMVQVMESWFLADKEALEIHYQHGFDANRLPATSSIEDTPKDRVSAGLKEATRHTKKGEYHKTKHAPALLAAIDPAKVRAASPWCDRLFRTIEEAIDGA
jgi:hypothetical protein